MKLLTSVLLVLTLTFTTTALAQDAPQAPASHFSLSPSNLQSIVELQGTTWTLDDLTPGQEDAIFSLVENFNFGVSWNQGSGNGLRDSINKVEEILTEIHRTLKFQAGFLHLLCEEQRGQGRCQVTVP